MKSTEDRNGSRRQPPAKQEKAPTRPSCPRWCYKCLPIASGFIILLVITGSITLIRGVLEVPIIVNGFAPNRPAQTSVATSLSSTSITASPTHSSTSTSMQGRSNTYTSQHLQTPASSVTPASHLTRFSDTTSLSIVTEDICNFVGELKVKVSSSITLSPDYRSAENTSIAAAVEQKIKQAYRSSTFNTKYISTQIIGVSNVYSAIRFMMQFLCSVINQEKQMTEILQQGLGTITLSDSEQLTVDLKSTIIWCHDNMLICDNGYCTGKTNAFCDGVKDCWNGSDEEGCDCQASSAGQCPSVVTLTGRRYKFLCHGALISNKWVLTSASCANQSSISAICVGSPKPEKYRIAEHRIVDWKGEGIALLHLESEVNFKDFQPITLPDSAGQTETAQTTCRIAIQKDLQTPCSWNVIASNKQTIVMRQNCQKISKCQVATGSPLVCRKENSTWVLTAVRGDCSASTMTYRRVNKALALIKKYIN